MMNRTDIPDLLRDPLLRAGFALQCISAALLGIVILSIRMKWIDIIEIGLRNGIDKTSPELDALYRGVRILILFFGAGFFLYAGALHKIRKKRKAQPAGGAYVAPAAGAPSAHP